MTSLEENLNKILEEKETKLLPENIKKGINILGIEGEDTNSNIQSENPAINDDIMLGKEAYVNDTKLVGTMADNGQLNFKPSEGEQMIPEGYTSGGTIEAVDITTLNDYKLCDKMVDVILGNRKPYTELEWIEFTGTQYVDTEIPLWSNENWKIEMITTPTKIFNYNHYLSIDDDDNEHETWIASDGYYYCRFHSGMKSVITSMIANEKYHIIHDFKDGICTSTINDEVTDTTDFGAFISDKTIRFGHRDTGKFIGKLHSLKFYSNDNLILNLVPVIDLTEKVCLYDKVNSKYYYNKGTGDFIAGEVI